jgi:hypothetical protein
LGHVKIEAVNISWSGCICLLAGGLLKSDRKRRNEKWKQTRLRRKRKLVRNVCIILDFHVLTLKRAVFLPILNRTIVELCRRFLEFD